MDLAKVTIKNRSFLYKPELYTVDSQEFGKKSGMFLLFNKISYIFQQQHIVDSTLKLGSKPNRWHLHIAWLLTVGQTLVASELCPYCPNGKRNVIKWFATRRDFDGNHCYGLPYVCCDCESCQDQIVTDRKTSLLPFKFSSLRGLSDSEQKRMGNFFKEIFLGKGRFDSEKAYQLFLSQTPLIY